MYDGGQRWILSVCRGAVHEAAALVFANHVYVIRKLRDAPAVATALVFEGTISLRRQLDLKNTPQRTAK